MNSVLDMLSLRCSLRHPRYPPRLSGSRIHERFLDRDRDADLVVVVEPIG